ncbi:Cof-type HAD-IIB family hydrolase [Caproicibacter sp. BJN0012]|uniref:Cof-type HAD-IIB family hydrolase n=1 Tax=Caproicibacter sp. BJN0012 TaxID=3110227 RepID=UPI002E1212D1
MGVKLIALDLDGTTLKNDHFSVSVKNRRAIVGALAQGVVVVPATGRFLNGIPRSVKKIAGIRYAITSNGAFVWDFRSNKVLYSNLLLCETAAKVLALAKDINVYAEAYCEGKAYMEYEAKPETFNRDLSMELHSLFWKRKKVQNLVGYICAERKSVEKIEIIPKDHRTREEMEEKLKGLPLSITTSGMDSIEVTNFGATKGEALAHLCRYLQIKPEEVMAIGDNCNDIEMLRFAGLAVAVDNADGALKKIADFIVRGSDLDGVAEAIERFV